MLAPCKDCENRVLHCHSTCEKYLAFRQEKDSILKKQRIEYLSTKYLPTRKYKNK